jgi:hypothetical protein
MDLTQTIVPKSDQLNAEDLIVGPVTVTIESVTAGSAEQPVDIHVFEFPGRAYRPSKSMRRVMVAAWGPEASTYVGHRLTLYRDPAVTFGGDPVGGIKISHLSHITKRMSIALTVTRGKRSLHVVDPLPDAPAQPTGITGDQSRRIVALMKTTGLDLAGVAALATQTAGRDIGHPKELTHDEADAVITALEQTGGQP